MKPEARILVIDDERGIRDLLAYELGAHGYQITTAENGEEGLRLMKENDFQLVLSDVKMPKLDGLGFLKAVKKASPAAEVILASGQGTIETAVTAMKEEAFDFIEKPFNIDQLLDLVGKAVERRRLKATLALYEESQAVFKSIKLERLFPVVLDLALKLLAADDAAILLLGEDGSLELSAALGLESEEERSRFLEAARAALERAAAPWVADVVEEEEEESQSVLVQPLVVEGEKLGALLARRRRPQDSFASADLRHLSIFCAQAAQAIHNARLFRRLEETQRSLIQSEKLNAIGRLTGGIAHELNNPLSCIMGSAQLLLEEKGLSASQKEDLDCILEQTRRCAYIVSEVLQFSRKREPQKEVLSLGALLDSSLRLAKFDLPPGVQVVKDIPAPPPLVEADPMQLKQVFINLIRNAGQAMAESAVKKLTVTVGREPSLVRIRFADSGPGLSSESLGRLFEPFFTTKPEGHGTGLGLSVCRDIIAGHGGAIRAGNAEGGGAVFTIELPAAAEHSP